ncbi:MAG TPA: hypothetical protein PLH72_13085 [Vicinamibacterales bacterium]|nr:hypothetical protein [Vicinamibacterales bacterium]
MIRIGVSRCLLGDTVRGDGSATPIWMGPACLEPHPRELALRNHV